MGHARGSGERICDESLVDDVRKLERPDCRARIALGETRKSSREPRLADPARSGDRDEPCVPVDEQRAKSRELVLAADELRKNRRQRSLWRPRCRFRPAFADSQVRNRRGERLATQSLGKRRCSLGRLDAKLVLQHRTVRPVLVERRGCAALGGVKSHQADVGFLVERVGGDEPVRDREGFGRGAVSTQCFEQPFEQVGVLRREAPSLGQHPRIEEPGQELATIPADGRAQRVDASGAARTFRFGRGGHELRDVRRPRARYEADRIAIGVKHRARFDPLRL